MKVLVVDDEPNILLSLEFLMKKQGYQVFIARNGQEALDTAFNEKPQVIILDIMMPDVDGYEVCQRIKKEKTLSNTKIIFLTAKTKEADIQKGYDAGADFYMTKPFSTRELMKKIQEYQN
ncbi:MAG: response regulator [Cytophagales bacterium]|nr:MAG: response regulator [Cytophagales bacterium]